MTVFFFHGKGFWGQVQATGGTITIRQWVVNNSLSPGTRWLSDKACGCDCGKCPGFPVAPLPAGATFGADPKVFPYPFPGDTAQHDYSIEDALKVPADLEPGEYVVGYRWDCEATSRAHTTALLPPVLGHPKLALRSLPCVVQRCGAPAATSPSCRDPQPM